MLNLFIIQIDPLVRPQVMASSDHCFHTWCPSVSTRTSYHFLKSSRARQISRKNVCLAEGIIDDPCMSYILPSAFKKTKAFRNFFFKVWKNKYSFCWCYSFLPFAKLWEFQMGFSKQIIWLRVTGSIFWKCDMHEILSRYRSEDSDISEFCLNGKVNLNYR